MVLIDEKDEKIIDMLSRNSRISYTEISAELDISETAVRNRIKELQKRDIIDKFTVEIDPSKVGYNSVAFVGVDVDPDKFLKAAKKLSEESEIRNVFLTTGDHMIMMEIWAKDGEELAELLSKKVGSLDGVERICPAIVLEKIK